ncbi:unnamed protein product [Sphagnum troendelagicum]|uniref:Uncharacterized protein n=1 Tax=Sphagnum troendelagicum TaxID=128251 RepID=A0ABP0TQI2_9BRYO
MLSQAVLRWCKTQTAEVSECKENFNLTQDIDEDETEEEEVDDLIQKILRLEQGEMRCPHVRPNDDHEDDANDDEGGYLCACNVQFHSPPKGFKAEENTLGINVWDSIQGLEQVDISNANLVTGVLKFWNKLGIAGIEAFCVTEGLI